MARTPSGTHPKAGKVFHLSDLGYSQRRVAAETGLSQSTVQRILASPRPDSPDDPEGVIAEFDELYAAEDDGSLDAYRYLHEVAKACHAGGFDVKWRPLRYLTALSAALIDAGSQRERNKLRAEIASVYQDMREWRDRNA